MSEQAFTPGPWDWRELGGRLLLVTRHNGSRVVLCARGYNSHIETRDTNGTLRDLTGDHPNARLIAAAPTMAAYIERRAADDPEALAIWRAIIG